MIVALDGNSVLFVFLCLMMLLAASALLYRRKLKRENKKESKEQDEAERKYYRTTCNMREVVDLIGGLTRPVFVVKIGGGRTVEQIITSGIFIDPDVIKANLPLGDGPMREVMIELFEFDHDPIMSEVGARCEESGYDYPTYEDGLCFEEQFLSTCTTKHWRPHVFIPKDPWQDYEHIPCALTWEYMGSSDIGGTPCILLSAWYPQTRWHKICVFARRKLESVPQELPPATQME